VTNAERTVGVLVLMLGLVLGACSSDEPLEGTYRGTGDNRLVLLDGRWRLHSGPVEWVGRYSVDGDRLSLRTDRVIPELGHGTDCYDDVERYAWSVQDGALILRFGAPEACNCNRNSVLQTAGWQRVG
jgi:hypothetical protein